jgi:hypothetical protein
MGKNNAYFFKVLPWKLEKLCSAQSILYSVTNTIIIVIVNVVITIIAKLLCNHTY